MKKVISGFLSILFMFFFVSPICAETPKTEKENLSDFLRNTETIEASYKYPSMKISYSSSDKTKLSSQTPIVIRCDQAITTRDVVNGSTVRFAVLSTVKSANGEVLIAAGTPVTAQITFSKRKGMVGKSGEVTVSDFHTTAVDGTYVPLSASVSSSPDDKLIVSVVLSVLICPLFLLMQGEDAQVPAGTTKTAYVASDVYIKTIVK